MTKKVVPIRLFVLAILSLLSLCSSAQKQKYPDSAAIHEVNAAFKLTNQYPDTALAIAERALLQSGKSGSKELAAFAYKTRGWAWLHKGSYDRAYPDLLRSLDLFRELKDTLEEMYMYVNLGIAYSNHSQFVNGLKYLLLADSLTQIRNDISVKAEVKRQMGILYREQGQYQKATANFRESIAMFRSTGDTLQSFDAVTSLCLVYMAMSEPDSCLVLLNTHIPPLSTIKGHNYQKAMFMERYGDAYFATAHYEKAMENYNNAYKLFDSSNNKGDMAYEAMNVGRTYRTIKKYHDAETFLLISYRLSDSLKIANYALDGAGQLASLYQSMGDWRKAFLWLEKKDSLQESLHLTSQNEKIAQLQTQYEAEKKDREIALLKEDQELNRAILQRQKVFQIGALMTGLLLLLIGFLVISRYRVVQKARRLIELEKMRNNIARDLHDDMGSALSSIHIISKMAMENGGEKLKTTEHLKKIHENSGAVLENMSDIVWTINPVNDTLEKVLFKMNEFAADIFEPLNIQYTFNQSVNFQHVRLDLQTRKDLYLVFKEAVNNAAKYSRCKTVAITVSESERQIELQVKDDGIGFDRNNTRHGNGLKNMEERARRLHGVLRVDSAPGAGTTITLRIRSHD